ncbi:hypothetical protein [Mesonia maritima]|uniref:Uncharacterized protein n=1 Tax=Mesonia maritima TaxID=1793873 RepID=A0ABU1K1X7_9FLAO|nr:hypothetical protein [Mesonia maritima]MDR6299610.1 hypothetical protein [Mesonia maritima]
MLFLLLAGSTLISCSKDDSPGEDPIMEPMVLECNSFKNNNPDVISVLENRGDGVDYIIDCVISVEIDLVIEPGVVIEFTEATGMKIKEDGSVNAVGTLGQKIKFTGASKVKGSWKGIISESQSVKNRFEQVDIFYAGDSGLSGNNEVGSLILDPGAYFRLKFVNIQHSTSYGITATWYDYDVEMNDCVVNDSDLPIYATANLASHIVGGNFTGNTTNAIRLKSDAGPRKISTPQTWTALSVPYRMANTLVIEDGAILTIQPGVIVEFEDTKGITIDKSFDDGSALKAEGAPDNPIVFTGVTKTPGAWSAISIRRTSSVQNIIDNVIIEYAGGSGSGGGIEMWVDPVLTVTNTTFKDISACALYNRYGSTNPNLTESNNSTENVSGGYMCNG